MLFLKRVTQRRRTAATTTSDMRSVLDPKIKAKHFYGPTGAV